MTAGALIFAHNNEQYDYVAMAEWAAKRIRRHLGIPVALVTDLPTDRNFDKVILWDRSTKQTRKFGNEAKPVIWNNHSRVDAYDLSPWDKTLVLDADYVVASGNLKVLLDADVDFLAHRWAHDITGVNDFRGLNYFGDYDMPQWWATVMVFRKTTHSHVVFECMKMIRSNWGHYCDIYHNPSRIYRNDHALSIALNIACGHQNQIDEIPWSLATIMPGARLQQLDQDRFRVDFQKYDQRPAWIELLNQDFHAMGKDQLEAVIAHTC